MSAAIVNFFKDETTSSGASRPYIWPVICAMIAVLHQQALGQSPL